MLALLKQPPVGAIEKEGFFSFVSRSRSSTFATGRFDAVLLFFFFFIFSLSSGRLGGNSKTRIYPVYLVYLNNKPWEIIIIKKGMGLCSAMRMLLLLSWPISSLSRCLHFTCERFLKKKKKKKFQLGVCLVPTKSAIITVSRFVSSLLKNDCQ